MVQGSVDTQVGYTQYIKSLVDWGRYGALDTESDDTEGQDYLEAQDNAYQTFRADTTLNSGMAWDTYPLAANYGKLSLINYYGAQATFFNGGFVKFTLSAAEIANTKMAKVRTAGTHHFAHFLSVSPWYQDYRVDEGSLEIDFNEGPAQYTSGADLYDNIPSNLDLSIPLSQLNEGYDQAGRQYRFNPTAACFIDFDFDETVITGMSGFDLYLWFRVPNLTFPYRFEFSLGPNGYEYIGWALPQLILYY